MIHALWLTSWYPNDIDAMNGDFVQRHARAAALFCKVHVIHLEADKNNLMHQDLVIKNNTEGNLSETIVMYKPQKNAAPVFSKAFSLVQYIRLFKQQVQEYIAQKGKPSIVHVHVPMKAGIVALWIKRKYNIPFVVTEHWTIYHDESPDNYAGRDFIFRYYTKKIVTGASLFLPVSNNLGEMIQQKVSDVSFRKIANAVNTEYFYYTHAGKEKDFTFVHASTYNYQKNAEAIVRAFCALAKENPAAKLIMIGDASNAIKKLAASLNISSQILFTGLVSYTDVAKQLQRSHALVMFSRYENLPCIIAEALCCGLPVISSDVGGISEMIDDTNGILIQSEDESALLHAMKKIIEDYNRFNCASIAAAAAEKYSYEKTGSEIFDVYKKIIQ